MSTLPEIRNAVGERLATNLWRHPSDISNIIIICHGLLTTKDRGFLPDLSKALSCSTLRFDFSGNGESEGEWEFGSMRKQTDDLRSVVVALRQSGWHIAAIVGHSMGADISLLYAAEHDDVPLVVNVSGRFDLTRGIREKYSDELMQKLETEGQFVSPFGPIKGKKYVITKASVEERINTRMDVISNIDRTYILTIHGTEDEVIPVGDAYEIDARLRKGLHCMVILPDPNHAYKGFESTLFHTINDYLIQHPEYFKTGTP
eukprot:GILJ01009886.1.p1 GENE.GILJ01009886.1~~GILJ01009886.1.p1  ORF type:complete len:260 (-),score=26.99 GILJ01009886.1:246-1025(-)